MRENWTRDQLLIAFKLYCEIPFGKLHSKNTEIIKYSKAISRTPSSLAMKLVNIASLDPVIVDSGRRGLSGASKSDRAMWQEMNENWEVFSQQALNAEAKLGFETASPLDMQVEEGSSYQGFTREVKTQARIGQAFFRKCVLSAYNFKCCISGLSVPQFLVASHIVPWLHDEHNRLNPYNGLCLSVLHDRAFDAGWISIDHNYKVIISPFLKNFETDYFLSVSILEIENRSLLLPDKFQPDQLFLKHHRESIFKAA